MNHPIRRSFVSAASLLLLLAFQMLAAALEVRVVNPQGEPLPGIIVSKKGDVLTIAPVCHLVGADGVPLQIVVGAAATPAIRAAAATLADYLGRITGAVFEVVEGDGSNGIVVGLPADFPEIMPGLKFAPEDPFRREEYLLHSHPLGVFLLGATPLAVEHAVWDLLERLGYRQFFPGKNWEIIPQVPRPEISAVGVQKPDFVTRRIWYGLGFWSYNIKPYEDWCARNRAAAGFRFTSRHIYQEIIRNRREVFEAHPEYSSLINGKRRTQGGPRKFCISNPDLQALVVDWAFDYLRKHPDEDTVTMEPSDGIGWCECADCAKLGSVSDQAVFLANHVAAALEKEMPGKFVGMNAYSMHSPPPNLQVHPKVIVKVQNGFIRGGFSFDQLLAGWQAKGATIGVGEYYSVFPWDKSRPANQKGSDLAYIIESIPRLHRQGARIFFAESSDLWGALGLGHYLAAKLLWSVAAANNVDAILDDFFSRAFGPAREPMERFFRRIYRFSPDDRRPLVRSDLVARLYRDLAEARELAAAAPEILARLDDLLLFVRYEELFQEFENAGAGAPQQKAFEALLWHAWRIRETMMIHSKAVVRMLPDQVSGVTLPAILKTHPRFPELRALTSAASAPVAGDGDDLGGTAPEADPALGLAPPPAAGLAPLNIALYSAAEKAGILAAGIIRNQPVDLGFEPVPFSDELVPAAALGLPEVAAGDFNSRAPVRHQKFYTWRDENAPGQFRLRISGGHIVHHRKIASNVQVRLFAAANPLLDEPVAVDTSVPPDGEEREVLLNSEFTGLHRLEVYQQANRAKTDTAVPNLHLTLPASLDDYNQLAGPWSLYFYVPKGTAVLGGYAAGAARGRILDGNGRAVFNFASMSLPGFFSVPVPAGQDGTLWKFDKCEGRRALLTVPPFMARRAAELLLPKEVVDKDAGRAAVSSDAP